LITIARLVLAASLLMTTVVVTAAVYKWVDAQGNVYYGERPPSGARSGVREVHVPAPHSPAPGEPSATRFEQRQKLLDALEADRKERRDKASQSAAVAEKRAIQCAKARKFLQAAPRARGLLRKGESGAREEMTDAERNAYMAQFSKDYKKHC